jgi:hypothetical protein
VGKREVGIEDEKEDCIGNLFLSVYLAGVNGRSAPAWAACIVSLGLGGELSFEASMEFLTYFIT